MKVSWDKDEWYPVYTISKYDPKWTSDEAFEITDSEYADYARVMKEFMDWQDKLKGMVGE